MGVILSSYSEVFYCSLLLAGSSIAVKVNECRAWGPGAGRGSRAPGAKRPGARKPGAGDRACRAEPGVPGGAGRTGREVRGYWLQRGLGCRRAMGYEL